MTTRSGKSVYRGPDELQSTRHLPYSRHDLDPMDRPHVAPQTFLATKHPLSLPMVSTFCKRATEFPDAGVWAGGDPIDVAAVDDGDGPVLVGVEMTLVVASVVGRELASDTGIAGAAGVGRGSLKIGRWSSLGFSDDMRRGRFVNGLGSLVHDGVACHALAGGGLPVSLALGGPNCVELVGPVVVFQRRELLRTPR